MNLYNNLRSDLTMILTNDEEIAKNIDAILSSSTNKKGVATFKVKKLSKGKFTGKLKFKGDKYYKGISGKVKVIVK